ncbi:hypothetical protein [Patulibacter sp.]|uniref:hypothetical protein n=1 Tax=Patulibacter sp. TaxID=1912859 RepID=UPI0027262E13|nr:hypothetical protein [Patulibacter sp.]MDO9409658.1 hypothetical protein [Patulibacter sp.]
MPDRTFTPHELHQRAISVLDRIELIAAHWRRGRLPAAADVDAVAAAVVDLRTQVERTALAVTEADPAAEAHLSAALLRIADAIRLVDRLAQEHPRPVPATPRIRAVPADADPPVSG